ncbi:MAG: iron-containing alcohol dehydrogenase family protein [Lautropia sp.]
MSADPPTTARRPAPAPFTHDGSGTRVWFEPGAVERLAEQPAIQGAKRIMLVCGQNTARSQAFARIRRTLGERVCVTLDRVVEHSMAALVEDGAALAGERAIDLLLAVGGGSASDTAKAIAIVLAEGGRLADHANVFTPPANYQQRALPAAKLPIVVVPTTLSAAEVTPGLGIHDGAGRKLLFWDAKVVPRLIVLDPVAACEVPAGVFATTGMNALAHCVEGLYSRTRNPICDALALGGIELLARALPAVVADPGDVAARGGALTGANLSGQVIANARVGVHHAICHALGTVGGLSHGVANAVMLPFAMRYNLEVAAPALARVALALGEDLRGHSEEAAANRAISAVDRLRERIGVPRCLRETGLDRSRLERIAAHTMGDRGLYFNPRPTTDPQALIRLLETAW